MLKSESMSRFTQIGLFTNPGVQLEIDEQIREDKSLPPFLTRSFHNKLLNHSLAFLKNYQEYFTGKFLFIEGGFPLRFKVPQTGVLYLIELPFLLIGLFSFLKERKKEQLFILFWLVAGPIAASLTIEDVPNFQRALITLPAFVILISYGIFQSLNFVKNKRYIILALIIIISFYLYSLLFFLHQYFVHQKVHRPWYRMYEMKELVSEVTKREDNYQKIIMTKNSTEPYIFFLFYQKTNPADYQKEAYKLSWKKNWTLGKYEFMVDDCPLQIDDVEKNAGYLYIEKEECLKYRWKKTVKQIKRTDGTVALKLLEVDLPEYQKWKKLGNKLYKELYEK